MARLTGHSALPPTLAPGYAPQAHGVGIVHIGIGAFHKAHQADYTDQALAARGGDWRIIGVSLRSRAAVAELGPQDGRYTLIERSATGTTARVIGALAGALSAADGIAPVLTPLTDPACRIVSLTVTEKAYGLDRAARGCDPAHSAVAADLMTPEAPQGVLGLLARALALRFARGLPPFTVLCCDNLPENGALLRGAVVDFARRCDPDLAARIAAEVAFPATMVDRITPAATEETRHEAEALTGFTDLAAVETEAFRQWVIEDHFPQGRPAWEVAGAIFVADVAPYEQMKLRMLNGSHSMLAYAGFHAGCRYVRDVMADADLAPLVRRHLAAAAASLPALPGLDLGDYATALTTRFANPAIAHETFQIAMDGTEKLPQRIFAPALDALKSGRDLAPFAFASAAWMRHASGAQHDCAPYALRDPRAAEIGAALAGTMTPETLWDRLSILPGLMPETLRAAPEWRAAVLSPLRRMMTEGMRAAIRAELHPAS